MPTTRFNDVVIVSQAFAGVSSSGEPRYWAKRLCVVRCDGQSRPKFISSKAALAKTFSGLESPARWGPVRGVGPGPKERAAKIRGLPGHRWSGVVGFECRYAGGTLGTMLHSAAFFWQEGYVTGSRFYEGAPKGRSRPDGV